MKLPSVLARGALALALAATLPAFAQEAVDMGQSVPDAKGMGNRSERKDRSGYRDLLRRQHVAEEHR